jgi:hypothetical protein
MPMELLQSIAAGTLPCKITRPADIDKVRVLAAAQLIDAVLPDVYAEQQIATVLAITAEGREALLRAEPTWAPAHPL